MTKHSDALPLEPLQRTNELVEKIKLDASREVPHFHGPATTGAKNKKTSASMAEVAYCSMFKKVLM